MAYGQSVTFESKSAARCESGVLNVSATVVDAVDAVEIVFVIQSTGGGASLTNWSFSFAPTLTSLDTRVVDTTSGADHVLPDTIRIAAIKNGSGDELAAGTHVIGRVNYTTSDVCSGTIGLSGATFAYAGGNCGFGCGLAVPAIVTQFVKSSDNSLVAPTITPGTITIVNVAPTIAAIPNATIPWGTTYLGTAVGADLDMPRGCETLTYSKVTGPAAMTVNPTTGAISWPTVGADVCVHNVTIAVTDKCGAAAQTSFTICVSNQAPSFTNCPVAPIVGFAGLTISGDLNATDPDAGPNPLIYNLISFSGPGVFSVNPANGMWSWPTLVTPAYTGTFTASVAVSDAANVCSPCSPANADTCTFTIKMYAEGVVIEKVHGQLQGQYAEVDVSLLPSTFVNYPIAGFDLLIQYDQSALSFTEALPGQFILDCGWEYFTYRTSAFGNCSGGCPSGMVKLVALAETNNGPNHPDCFVNTGSVSEVLAKLRFLVSNDRTLNCMFAPIGFYWLDCTDNGLSSVTGDTFMISNFVFDYYGAGGVDTYTEISDSLAGFPTDLGAQAECNDGIPGKGVPLNIVNFWNGGVDIICSDSIDARGDVNLNDLAYEIADAVMFTNYFVQGLSAFNPANLIQGRIAATDVNADGLTLSVADLVYLIRVIVGDAQAVPKTTTGITYTSVKGGYSVSDDGVLTVSAENSNVGALYLELAGNVVPTMVNDGANMAYQFDGTNTRVIVLAPYENVGTYEGFSGAVLNIDNAEIVKLEMANDEALPIVAKLIPTKYALAQNYPNPFNPSTTIEFALPIAGNYTLTIYNVNGQVVESFEGSAEAGIVTETWNATNTASGVYFYKLSAGQFTSTKKMVLLK
uniref:FG-GAP repeat protein n=1 Tax=uncultured bacterium pAW1 TaxID=1781155 RepID=A0A1C9U4P8_9BACT|nr:FG-GAP repeat protein [uncultured bacterium pAW1]